MVNPCMFEWLKPSVLFNLTDHHLRYLTNTCLMCLSRNNPLFYHYHLRMFLFMKRLYFNLFAQVIILVIWITYYRYTEVNLLFNNTLLYNVNKFNTYQTWFERDLISGFFFFTFFHIQIKINHNFITKCTIHSPWKGV